MMRNKIVCSIFALFIAFAWRAAHAQDDFLIGAGRVQLNDPIPSGTAVLPESLIVNFPAGSFSSVPAVFVLPSNVNADPATLRVHSVTTSGFEIFVSESDGEDNLVHPSTDFEYFAIEPGVYNINGVDIEVALETGVTEFQSLIFGGDSLRPISFTNGFADTPVVVTEIQTLNNDTTLLTGSGSTFSRNTEPFLETSTQDLTTSGFNLALERAETSAGALSTGETIAWIAVDDEADIVFDDDSGIATELRAFFSADSVTGDCTTVTLAGAGVSDFSTLSPAYFGNMIDRDGNNGGWLRLCTATGGSVAVQIEEDMANDTEQSHTTEQTAFVGFSRNFQTSVSDPTSPPVNMVVGSDTISAGIGAGAGILFPVNVSFTSLFGGNFASTPVVVPMTTTEGNGDPAYVRVWNVSATGFTMAQTVPEGTTTAADAMTVDFLAVVPDITHELPDGTLIEAETLSTTNCIGSQTPCSGAFVSQSFSNSFTNPVVLAAAQTIANDPGFNPADPANPHLDIAMINQTNTGFDVAFDYSETSLSSPPTIPETLGWIAMEGGLSGIFRAAEDTTATGNHIVEFRTIATPVNINGVDDASGCFSNSFPTAFTQTSSPVSIATENSRNGGDGGWLRRCVNTATTIGVAIQEDQANDEESSHGGTEEASAIAFSDVFAWTTSEVSHTKLVAADSDPTNLTTNPKAVPGATIAYTLNVENLSRVGTDQDAITITDAVPPNTTLFVGDADGAGCPVEFIDGFGSDSSGLTFTCATGLLLLSTTTPGGCVPDADGFCPFSSFSFGADFDASITEIKLVPKGEFRGSFGANAPQFNFIYRVQIN